jgi:pilus assembly protein CpaF
MTRTGELGTGVDMLLVHAVHRQVGERLQAHRDHRKQHGETKLDGEGERQYARKLISDALGDHAEQLLVRGDIPLTPEVEHATAEAVFARIYGAGRLQRLLDDESIENVDINGCDVVWIQRENGAKELGDPVAASDEELIELIQNLASYAGRSSRAFDSANVKLDLALPDGSRLAAIMEVSGRPCLSIRRHRFEKATLADMRGNQTITEELSDFLSALVLARCNVIIAGETGAGKTTLLRAMASEIPPGERIVTIENSLELGLASDEERHPDCVELEERMPNSEGLGGVNMDELVRHSLRMNMRRVIVGEVRGGEVIAMLQAMSQGNDGSLSTLHARDAREVFDRITTYALIAPERMPREAGLSLIAGGIDFVVFMRKQRGTGKRRVSQVIEVNGFDPVTGVSSSELFAPDASAMGRRTDVTVSDKRREKLEEAGWLDSGPDWESST